MAQQTIPQPVLDVIATYCKSERGNIMPIIEHAIHDFVGGNPVHINLYAETLVRAILHDIDPKILSAMVEALRQSGVTKQSIGPIMVGGAPVSGNPILMAQPQTMTPVKHSPHSPKGRQGPKPPYWFKVVTSVDTNTPNGYGLKGKFINHDDLANERAGRIVVAQTKDFKTKEINLYVLEVNPNTTHGHLALANGSQLTIKGAIILGQFKHYHDLFDVLMKNHGIPGRT